MARRSGEERTLKKLRAMAKRLRMLRARAEASDTDFDAWLGVTERVIMSRIAEGIALVGLRKVSVLERGENCVICLGEMQVGDDEASMMGCCSHVFHSRCIVAWIRRKPNCPLCRQHMQS